MNDINIANEQRVLALALRAAADFLDGLASEQAKETEPEYVTLQEYLMGVVKQLDTTGDLAKVTEELLGRKEKDLHDAMFTRSEYVEWLKRQIKTAEQNLESRKQAA